MKALDNNYQNSFYFAFSFVNPFEVFKPVRHFYIFALHCSLHHFYIAPPPQKKKKKICISIALSRFFRSVI